MKAGNPEQVRGESRRDILRKGVVAAAIAGLGLSSMGEVSAAKKTDAIPIDGPTEITESGYYVFTRDIVGEDPFETGISRLLYVAPDVNDITIDGQGYTLDGQQFEGLTGISMFPNRDVTIKNLRVANFATASIELNDFTGGTLSNVVDCTIQNVYFTNCDPGIQSNQAERVTITDCLFENNDFCISLGRGNNSSVARNRFQRNGLCVNLSMESNVVLEHNQFHNNDSLTISGFRSRNPTIANNSFVNNLGGPSLLDPITCLIRNNTITGSEWEGISIDGTFPSGSPGIRIEHNKILRNKRGGVAFDAVVEGAKIRQNIIKYNGAEGVRFEIQSTDNEVSKNLIAENETDGILLIDSDENEIFKNRILNNGGDGVELRAFFVDRPEFDPDPGSDNNVIRKNVIKRNGGLPIVIDEFSTGNVVEDNKTDQRAIGGDSDTNGRREKGNNK